MTICSHDYLYKVGAFARRVRDAQLESQTVANGPGLVPVPAQSLITHPLTMMGAATQPTYHGDGGPLRHTWSPSMSMADDEYRPDLKKTNGEEGVGVLEDSFVSCMLPLGP